MEHEHYYCYFCGCYTNANIRACCTKGQTYDLNKSKNILDTFINQPLNLEILAEEASEVCQIKSKIIRFGIDVFHPKNKVINRKKLENEIGHFQAMVKILIHHDIITEKGIMEGEDNKLKKLYKYYDYLNVKLKSKRD